MTLFGFLLLVIITAIVGTIGQWIGGYSRGGCLVSLLIGFLGAYVGVWLARQFNLPPIFVLNVEGQPFPLVWAIIGATLVAAVLAFMYRTGRYRTL